MGDIRRRRGGARRRRRLTGLPAIILITRPNQAGSELSKQRRERSLAARRDVGFELPASAPSDRRARALFRPRFCRRDARRERSDRGHPSGKKVDEHGGIRTEERRSGSLAPLVPGLRLPEFESHWSLRSSRPFVAEASTVGLWYRCICDSLVGRHGFIHREGSCFAVLPVLGRYDGRSVDPEYPGSRSVDPRRLGGGHLPVDSR